MARSASDVAEIDEIQNTDYICSSKEAERPTPDTLYETLPTEDLQSIFSLVDTDYRNRTVKYGIPSSVSFELTYGCNEMCVHCYNPGTPHEECKARTISDKEMRFEDYVSALDQLGHEGWSVACLKVINLNRFKISVIALPDVQI